MPTPIAPSSFDPTNDLTVVNPTNDQSQNSVDLNATVATQRVLHVINGEHFSGAERVQDLLATQLPAFGFDVTFACVKPGRFVESRTSTDATLLETPMRFRFDIRPGMELAKLIQKEDIKLVHAHTPRSALIGAIAASKAGVPFVYHVHSPTGNDSTRRFRNWFNALCERLSIRHATRLITVSPSLQELMISEGFDPETVSYVANGVPSVPFDESRTAPNKTWTIGMVALFRPRKGIEVLLEALAKRRAAGDDLRLRAVGPFETPEYKREVLDLVESLGIADAIDWTGFTNDVQAELVQMDVMVLPSLFGEGLPMVILEAMAAGVPVVASEVEGIPIAIRNNEDGVLVPANDVAALSDGIAKITSGKLDWMQLRKNSYRRHAESFSDRAMADGLAKIYREILS